jgi:hypothetical protein
MQSAGISEWNFLRRARGWVSSKKCFKRHCWRRLLSAGRILVMGACGDSSLTKDDTLSRKTTTRHDTTRQKSCDGNGRGRHPQHALHAMSRHESLGRRGFGMFGERSFAPYLGDQVRGEDVDEDDGEDEGVGCCSQSAVPPCIEDDEDEPEKYEYHYHEPRAHVRQHLSFPKLATPPPSRDSSST